MQKVVPASPVVNEEEEDQEEEDAEVLEENKRRRDKKPLSFCKFIIKRPGLAFGLFLGIHIFHLVLSGVLVASGYNLLPIEFTELPMELRKDPVYLRQLAWRYRNQGDPLAITQKMNVATGGLRTRTRDYLELFYDASKGSGNVFTADALRKIQQIENELWSSADYQSSFCQLTLAGSCAKPESLIRYFDGSLNNSVPQLYDPNFQNISGIIKIALNNNLTKVGLQYHLGLDFDSSTLRSSITRSKVLLGWPLHSTKSVEEQRDIVTPFLIDTWKPQIEAIKKSLNNNPFELTYYSLFMWFKDVQRQAILDMLLAVGSLVFIFIYMCIQTGSVFVTGFAVFSIIACFIETNLVYRIIADYQYFGFFHVLSMFIILGIGADDIFVYYDNWKSTAHYEYKSLAHRMSDCYRRSVESMFYTSLTTAMAFFATSWSPLLAVSSFGLFSGILVLVNYLSVILFFPALVAFYHAKFERYKYPCGCCCGSKNEVDNLKETKKRKHAVVRFFRGPYFRFVVHPVVRVVLLVVFGCVLIVFAYFASQLQPDERDLQVYKASHNYGKAINFQLDSFRKSESETYINVMLVWGLKPNDLSRCHKTAFDCYGDVLYDNNFDLTLPNVQIAMKNFCGKLNNLTAQELEDLRIRRDPLTGQPQITCFIENLETFLQTEQQRIDNATQQPFYSNTTDLSLPLTQTKLTNFMQQHSQLYTASLPSTFYDYFGILISYWLTSGYSMDVSDDYRTMEELIKERKQDDGSTYLVNNTAGRYYGTKLRYVAIQINTSMTLGSLGHAVGLPVFERYENLMNTELAGMPPQLQSGFATTWRSWHWIKVKKKLGDTAIQGIIIGVCLALPILIIATRNILIGLAATFSICCSTVCVIGVIPLAGWKLGVLESLNLCLVVGLSVDYVVHLAEAYHRAAHRDRRGRTREALEKLGLSVLSGAVTTLGASFFMMFSQIRFFMQFGIFIFSVIFFSVSFALGMFITLMALCGPEGDTGSFKALIACCKKRCAQHQETQES